MTKRPFFEKAFLAAVLLSTVPAYSQDTIRYLVSFPNRVHHEAEITVRFSGLPPQPLQLKMSRSSPGRYALHEFAKNIYSVKAVDGAGVQLLITRPNLHQWDVEHHSGVVVVTYTLYGDHADGTYAAIDNSHAHLNMPATLLWAKGLEKTPISVTFRVPERSNWKIATQLQPTGDPHTFTAPDFQYLMDSPVELSNFTLRSWSIESGMQVYTIKLAVHHDGVEQEVDAYAEMAKAVVLEVKAVFGELPMFDFGEYIFIADYLSYVKNDGMEHRNSTVLTSSRPLKTNAQENLSVVAHEFFHAWNVERIRPQSLEPFDFENANSSEELWFGEGITSYYGDLILARAGIITIDEFTKRLTSKLSPVMTAQGRNYFSLAEMSMQAPFFDAASFIDQQNTLNTYISYYTFGAVVGLGLDLTLRSRFPAIDLDSLMRAMWQTYGKPAKPYSNEDIRRLLGSITGSAAFADSFFQQYIYGRDLMKYKELLANAGLLLRYEKPTRPFLGFVRVNYEGGNAIVVSPTIHNSPLYRAGVDRGDRILRIGAHQLAAAKDWDSMIEAYKPGDTTTIEFSQRSEKKTATITFEAHPAVEVIPVEHTAAALTDAARAFRRNWLESKASGVLPHLLRHCPKCKRTFEFRFEYCQYDGSELGIVPSK